ncbi:hypothetical protein HpHA162_06240 [Helicobacter pylori]
MNWCPFRAKRPRIPSLLNHKIMMSSFQARGVSVGDKDFFKDALKEKTPFFIMKKPISNLENR